MDAWGIRLHTAVHTSLLAGNTEFLSKTSGSKVHPCLVSSVLILKLYLHPVFAFNLSRLCCYHDILGSAFLIIGLCLISHSFNWSLILLWIVVFLLSWFCLIYVLDIFLQHPDLSQELFLSFFAGV